jgi:drug/metabolite transporter superfamily protein YnfA
MRRLFLGTMFVLALLTKTDPQSAHEYSRLGTVESLVDRGTYQLDDSIFIGTIDKIYRDGHFYSHQPPLLATLETPVYWLLHLPGTRFNNRGRSFMTYAFSLLTNGVAFALTVLLFARILALAGVPLGRRQSLAVLLPAGTWLLPYALVTNNHGISGLLVALLSYLLLVIEWQGANERRAMAIGGCLGLLVAIELLPIVSFAPLVLVYLIARRDLSARAWCYAGAGFLAPLLAHAILNARITGDVIPAGFHHELFTYPGSAFDDSSLSGGFKYDSWRQVASYGWASLFAGKGFFTFAPLLLLGTVAGFASWNWWRRARGPHIVLLGGALLSLAAALLTTNNYGGEAVGFRHATYVTPALLTMLLPWIAGERWQRHVVTGVASLSCVVMLLFAARNPWQVLSWTHAPLGTWDEYMPIVGKIAHLKLHDP